MGTCHAIYPSMNSIARTEQWLCWPNIVVFSNRWDLVTWYATGQLSEPWCHVCQAHAFEVKSPSAEVGLGVTKDVCGKAKRRDRDNGVRDERRYTTTLINEIKKMIFNFWYEEDVYVVTFA